WLAADASFRAIGFLIALAMILGASIVHLAPLIWQSMGRLRRELFRSNREPGASGAEEHAGPDRPDRSLLIWTGFSALAVILCTHLLLGVPLRFVLLTVGLVFVFVLINGISTGISDSNPISSAFVVTALVLAVAGVEGLFAAL